MWYIVIVIFLVAGVFIGSRVINNQTKTNNKIEVINSLLNENDTIKAMFSKQQIDQKLKRLAETPAPTNLSFGAMCYEMVARDNSVIEYVCPTCGEKTIYKKNKDEEKFGYIDGQFWIVYSCRQEIEKVKGVNIKFDEKEFCSKCSPKTKKPSLHLLINIEGQRDTIKLTQFSHMDIRLIQEFLDDKLIHKTDNDGEAPLINYIDRIKELLGIK